MRETHKNKEDILVVKAELKGENKRMFEEIQNDLNLKYNIEVFHYLLKQGYKKLFGDNHGKK